MPSPTSTLRRATIFVVADVLNRAIAFAVVPLWLRFMSLGEFGRLDVARTLSWFGAAVVGLGLPAAVTRSMATDDPKDVARTYATATRLTLAAGVVAWLAAEVVSGLLGVHLALSDWESRLGVLLGSALALGNLHSSALVYRGRAAAAALWPLCTTVLGIGAGLITMSLGVSSTPAILGGLLGGALISAGGLTLASRTERDAGTGRADIAPLLAYSLPLVPHLLGQHLLTYADRAMLLQLRSDVEAGEYGLAYLVASGVTVVVMALNKALYPRLYGALSAGHVRSAGDVVGSWVLGVWSVALTAAGLGPVVLALAVSAAGSVDAWTVVVLCAGVALHGSYVMLVNVLFHAGRTRLVLGATVVATAANVALNLVWIPAHGTRGAAAATLVSYAVLLTGVAWRVEGVHRGLLRAAGRGVIVSGVALAAAFVALTLVGPSWTVIVGGAAAVCVALFRARQKLSSTPSVDES
ncbi:MAG: oligosaccharide flippase family protein [Myxococcales bacterium]|nr:oligosaccharide flippase family protein [Myxococcales bacterium]MCB9530419.1 oligosaccharide flippase family protein [Myxococcales bacterium]MCB9533666.1 oligosaccharide flippase family protein [Myxococcales bacterium]